MLTLIYIYVGTRPAADEVLISHSLNAEKKHTPTVKHKGLEKHMGETIPSQNSIDITSVQQCPKQH